MLSRRFLQQRPRHVNVGTAAAATRLYSPAQRAPVPARFYSSSSSETGKASSSWSVRALAAPLAAGAAGLAVGLYYSSSDRSRDQHHHLPGTTTAAAAAATTTTAIPDLNQLGLSDQIAYASPPTSEDVTRQLNEGAWSCRPAVGEEKSGSAVSRYDGAQLGSNSPCEDRYLHGRFASPLASSSGSGSDDWMAWAVFDGHCGWQMSDLLTRELVPSVRRALAKAVGSGGGNGDGAEGVSEEKAIHDALKTAFTALDDSVVQTAAATIERDDLSFPEKARRLEAAYAGACALLALFDPATRTLRVASTGDCRAVLGERKAAISSSSSPSSSTDNNNSNDSSNSNWQATDLTTDHTGANPDEVARLQAQFPDEPNMVAGGRVWGMQPSRTFGDGMWKWPAALKRTLRQRWNGLSLPSTARYRDYKDGPYLTAEPAVTTVRVSPASDDAGAFLILATDGLWDMMTSAQAVDLVGRWIDSQKGQGSSSSSPPSSPDFGPTILGWKRSCQYEESKATVQDPNAAVHLIRNGLGGADDEMVRGALTFRYPNSRDIRDDITVQVVFFR
ncbi:hypothetical protein SLS62_009519 [Diatrype stigma]|uniref:PPM-type phosphatase domain-containing protein n=1 Tax=Diatrype stigma TaxID=117547 RepID=A0AAN9UGP5_9PEZI